MIYIKTKYTSGINITYQFERGTIYIVNCEYNINNQNGKLYINNILIKTFECGTPADSHSRWHTTFGCMMTDPEPWNPWSQYITKSIDGNIYEIIIINRPLTDYERNRIYNYLNNKWVVGQEEVGK